MGKLFGTNGVRGVFGQDFTLEFVNELILSIGSFFKKGPILVGYDGRQSSKIIVKTVCATLNSIGIDCKNAGLIPTPCLEFATKKLGYNGGIMITASHNPPQYNGIKPVASDGVEISREDELAIEDIYFSRNWICNDKWGITSTEDRSIQIYLDGIKSHIDVNKIRSKKFRVVLDLGNGAQAITAPLLCRDLECNVKTINENIDPNFSGRGSEPTPQNLSALSQEIQKHHGDFGIAFDGDGDRSIFCDDNGNVLTGDKSALILSRYILSKNQSSKIVTCLNSGSSIETITLDSNSSVIRTKVGSVEVSRRMVSEQAIIGFEENGGFMYGPHNQVRDGCMALALMLDFLSNSSKSLSEEIKTLPPSFTAKDKVLCSKQNVEKIIQTLKNENPLADVSDGIKIQIDRKNWVMIRPSGTEPIIRIYAEGESKEKLDSIISLYTRKVSLLASR